MNLSSLLEKASRPQRAFASFLLGVLGSFSMAPYHYWPLLILSLSGFYLLVDRTRSFNGALAHGWLFAFGYFFAGLFWVKNALLVEGNDFFWIWPMAVAGLPSLLACFMAVGAYAAKRIVNFKTACGFLGFVACISLVEWMRGFVFTGYPWNLFATTWGNYLPMIQNVAIGNVYFLNLLTILWFTLPGFLLLAPSTRKEKIFLGIFAAISFALCLGFGYWRLNNATSQTVPDVNIHIVQPNIAQSEKWDRSKMAEHFLKTIELSKPKGDSSGKTIIVWPETAMNYWLAQDPTAIKYITDMLHSYKGQAVLLTGLLRFEAETKSYFNSMVMIDADGVISNVYDKHHLVPFGEYIPFQKWIPLKPVVEFNGFVKGDGLQTLEALGVKYSPVVCYEIIFSGAVTNAGQAPDMIVNITNDAWYGVSPGPYQHYIQAVFRAVEEGIPVIRSANTGFSALITPFGQSVEKSELFKEYEKTLALPFKNMVFKNHTYLKNAFFVIFTLLMIFCSYHSRVKK